MRPSATVDLLSQFGDVNTMIKAIATLPGATWMKFSSTSVSNPPDGADRIIIRVPDTRKPPRFEQWLQIAINGSTGWLGRNVDFLAVQLLPDPTSPLLDRRPVVAFRGYSRTGTGLVVEGPGTAFPLTKCYSCHPSGLRAVIPAPTGSRAAGGRVAIKPESSAPLTGPASITEFSNEESKRLAVVGPKGYTASLNGPPFGPTTWFDREEFVAKGFPARPGRAKVPGCAAGLLPARQKAIVANMDCEKCHDGETDRGILNAGTSIETLFHKVVANTVAPMPPPEVWAGTCR